MEREFNCCKKLLNCVTSHTTNVETVVHINCQTANLDHVNQLSPCKSRSRIFDHRKIMHLTVHVPTTRLTFKSMIQQNVSKAKAHNK